MTKLSKNRWTKSQNALRSLKKNGSRGKLKKAWLNKSILFWKLILRNMEHAKNFLRLNCWIRPFCNKIKNLIDLLKLIWCTISSFLPSLGAKQWATNRPKIQANTQVKFSKWILCKKAKIYLVRTKKTHNRQPISWFFYFLVLNDGVISNMMNLTSQIRPIYHIASKKSIIHWKNCT